MSTTKAIVATTALIAVVCIPVGYQLGSTKEGAEPLTTQSAEVKSESARAIGRSAAMESGLFAEWRALHEKYGTNTQAMPLLHKAIDEMPDDSRKKTFHAALAAEWALVDPSGGFAFLKDGGQKRLLFEHWLELDADAAVDGLLKSENWEGLARQVITEIARKAPGRLPEIASKLPEPRQTFWDTPVREAFAVAASTQGLDWGKELAEKVTGPNRLEAFAGVGAAWGKKDIQGAIEWARKLPEGMDQDEVIRAALIEKAKVDPVSSLERLDLVPPGGSSGYFASTTAGRVLREAAKADFEGTVTWLAQNSRKLSREDLLGIANEVTERLNGDPSGFLARHALDGSLGALIPAIQSALLNDAGGQSQAVWDWLKWQPESEGIGSLKESILRAAAWHEPELALQLAEDLPQTKAGEKQARTLAQALLNGGARFERFEELYQQVPERLRGALLEEGFGQLRREAANHELWAERVDELPKERQAEGARELAAGWATRAPEEAWAWAAGLQEKQQREIAISQVSAIWAGKDPAAAAGSIAALPAGIDRDLAAAALIGRIASKHPHKAWEWAMSISDPAQAERSAFLMVQQMAKRDPITARAWLESGPFGEQVKAKLESMIETPGQGGTYHLAPEGNL